jgi:hypothetical protein
MDCKEIYMVELYVALCLDELYYKIIMLRLQLETHGSNLTEQLLETHTISTWKEAKHQTYGRIMISGDHISI